MPFYCIRSEFPILRGLDAGTDPKRVPLLCMNALYRSLRVNGDHYGYPRVPWGRFAEKLRHNLLGCAPNRLSSSQLGRIYFKKVTIPSRNIVRLRVASSMQGKDGDHTREKNSVH